MVTRNTEAALPRELRRGELSEIIIGTVVNYQTCLGHERGIRAREPADLLHKWGIAITANHARARLNDLARRGRIERAARGRFEGV